MPLAKSSARLRCLYTSLVSPNMEMTRRQEIIQILHENRQSAQQLANYFQTTLKEILEDLNHIEKSIKPKKLRIDPAHCKSCNFIFKERSRVSKPSKCPRCRSEWIEAQMFRIE